ncbi:TPA: hypothetical protein SHW33_002084 [Clostridioides difficile]|uniref:hypothetical protein n=1 Tax=Clostridioides difficile TaxID=1496 RepID=UPI0009447D36|nr:hypothetical protein [Clostridioides difficile]EGT3685815.1 hypothetical protein [Clostridioides difficile]EGT4878295.1 hypothetical protein [Clostridioides difficile]MBJ9769993.1 hypothetical protein [Clostridioides difficile]MBZ0630109.1 hypothetical protein [Clostridioides difficile]MDM0159573.1 hypothetical protein [Clostridioides difficile]
MDENQNYKLNKEQLRKIYLLMRDSFEVYKSLIEDKNNIFSGEFFSNIKGHLLSYVIEKAFAPMILPKNFPFRAEIIKSNNFGKKRVELNTNNLRMTIGKIQSKDSLPSKAKYKLKYAKENTDIENQLRFDFGKNTNSIKKEPYYGIISYKCDNNNNLEYLGIIFPDSEYKYIADRIDIPLLSVVEDNTSEEEDSILNKENLKELVLKDISNDFKN